jgi:hypothetical protein
MSVQMKITAQLVDAIRSDLRRPHRFAFERVGFVYCRFGKARANQLLIVAANYQIVADEHYIDDPTFGAVIDSHAFRQAMQHLHDHEVGAFHVHLHDHTGPPHPSSPDLRETAKFVPDFFHARRNLSHGALILSADRLSGRVWMGEGKKPVPIDRVTIVGAPLLQFGGIR